MNTKLLLSSVALSLLVGVSACKKKEAPAPAPAPADSSSTAPASGSAAPATAPADNSATAPASGGSTSASHPFGSQSGRVEYAVTGAEQGTEVLSWDNWGGRMAIQTKASMGTATEDKTTIVTADKVTTVDNAAKTGNSMPNPNKDLMASAGSTDDLTAKMMSQLGATKQGTDTVLDKTCDKWVSQNATTCVWQGIALKTEMTVNGQTTTKVATKIDTTSTPDPTAFDVPAGTTVQDMGAMTTPMSNMAPSTPDASTSTPAPATAPSDTTAPATPAPATSAPAQTTPAPAESGH